MSQREVFESRVERKWAKDDWNDLTEPSDVAKLARDHERAYWHSLFRQRPPLVVRWLLFVCVFILVGLVVFCSLLLIASEAKGAEPEWHAVDVALTWVKQENARKETYVAEVPHARIVRSVDAGGFEAVGIVFLNGFGCTGVADPRAIFSINCGDLGSLYNVTRTPGTPYKLQFKQRRTAPEAQPEKPKVRT